MMTRVAETEISRLPELLVPNCLSYSFTPSLINSCVIHPLLWTELFGAMNEVSNSLKIRRLYITNHLSARLAYLFVFVTIDGYGEIVSLHQHLKKFKKQIALISRRGLEPRKERARLIDFLDRIELLRPLEDIDLHK